MNLENLLFSVKKCVLTSGGDIEDIINDFDHRRSGLLSSNQFDQMLSFFGLSLQPAEYKMIYDSFSVAGGFVNVRKFADAVKQSKQNDVFQRENCESYFSDLKRKLTEKQTNLRDLLKPYDKLNRGMINSHDFIRAIGSFPSSEAIVSIFSKNGLINLYELLEEYDKVEGKIINEKEHPPIVDEVIRQIVENNIDVYYLFQSNDRFNNGRIPPSAFEIVLSRSGVKAEFKQLRIVSDFYKVNGLVNYIDFINDVKASSCRNKGSNRIQPEFDIDSLINQIKSECQSRKIQLSRLFSTYLNDSQYIPKFQFSSLLKQAGFRLTVPEIDFITKNFESTNGKIDISKFLNSTTVTLTSPRPKSANPDTVINKIKDFLKDRGIILYPRLVRFDMERSGEFNVSLIRQVLSQLGLLLTDSELEALQTKFPGRVTPNIYWTDFVDCVDPKQQVPDNSKNDKMEKISPSTPDINRIPSNVQSILLSIHQCSSNNNFSLLDDLRMLDKHRLGYIQASQFYSYMCNNFPKLNRADLSILLSHYGKFEFRYLNFARDINKIIPKNNSNISNSFNNDNFSTNKDLMMLIRKLKASCLNKLINPIDIFQPFDKTRIGSVPINRLEGCFDLIQYPISKEELKILIKEFGDQEHKERFIYGPLSRAINQYSLSNEDVRMIIDPEKRKEELYNKTQIILNSIRERLQERRLAISMFFQEVPKPLMEKAEFIRRLNTCEIVINPSDIDFLANIYKSENLVDWHKFCYDVDHSHLI